MRRLLISTVLLVMLVGAVQARAWKPLEPKRIWDLTDMPVEYFAPDPDTADVPSMPPGSALELIHVSIAHWWEDVPCSPLLAEYGGSVQNEGLYENDGSTRFYYEDPNSVLGTGILGATMIYYDSGQTIHAAGMDFWAISNFDIIMNNGINWGTPDDIYGGGCSSQYSYEAVMTHEIGHGFGLGHSCEKTEACPDPLKRGAVMYWSIGSCETGRELPNADDIAGINAFYGVYTDFEAVTETLGGVPLDVTFEVPDDLSEGVETYLWTFGDGSDQSAAPSPSHTYTDEGQYTVTLTVTGTNDECGEFEDTARKVGFVLACDTPEPNFEVQNLGAGEVQFRNTTPTKTFGCIQEYTWELGDDTDPVSAFEPMHDYGLEGSYKVTLTAAGPGGSDAVKKTIDVNLKADPRDDEPLLCAVSSHTPPKPSWALLTAAGIAIVVFWRRR